MGNKQSRRRNTNKSIAPMDTQEPPRLIPNNSVAPMDAQEPRGRVPEARVQFRVLIIGRSNAGKTSILQRVCDTTDSPVIYQDFREVCGPTFLSASHCRLR